MNFTAYAGLPVTVSGERGQRCATCGAEMFDGATIESLMEGLAEAIIHWPFRLEGRMAKFLRKRMGFTQAELADKLGLQRRATIADWEASERLDAQNDFNLRALASAHIGKEWPKDRLLSVLEHARTSTAPKPKRTLVYDANERRVA